VGLPFLLYLDRIVAGPGLSTHVSRVEMQRVSAAIMLGPGIYVIIR
jgi:hypothetical protein